MTASRKEPGAPGARAHARVATPSQREGCVLDVDAVTVRSAKRVLVDRISFGVAAGEVLAVIGPNGAGKSTLLEAVVGLRATDAGQVTVDGRPPRSLRENARLFSFLPDAIELPPETSVGTLLEHARSVPCRAEPLVRAIHRELAIAPLAETPVGALSRGERQRVALFAALVPSRPIVVLDEPFAPFDPLSLRAVVAAVRAVAAAGACVVTSVHQLEGAEKVADRVLLLAEGRAIAEGTLAEVRALGGSAEASLEAAFIALLTESPDAS